MSRLLVTLFLLLFVLTFNACAVPPQDDATVAQNGAVKSNSDCRGLRIGSRKWRNSLFYTSFWAHAAWGFVDRRWSQPYP